MPKTITSGSIEVKPSFDGIRRSTYPSGGGFATYAPAVVRPDFGLDEVKPTQPSPWTTELTGYYYVKSGGTANDNGTPAAPRGTIPTLIPAGSKIFIEGVYTSYHILDCLGTADDQVWFLSATAEQAVLNNMDIKGSYFILDGINFNWSNDGNLLLYLFDHAVFRNAVCVGDLSSGGVAIANGAYIVAYNNSVTYCGDVNTTADQDKHAYAVNVWSGNKVEHCWILGGEMAYCSGNGVQVNAGPENTDIHHVYIARNEVHHNKQSCFGIKQCEDVIVSTNDLHDAGNGSLLTNTNGITCQLAPNYVWFVNNKIYDGEGGIKIASDSKAGEYDAYMFILNNHIYNMQETGSYSPTNAYATAGIGVWGSKNVYIMHNTLSNVDGGIYVPTSNSVAEIKGNIINNCTRGYHFNFLSNTFTNNATVDRNVFGGSMTARVATTDYSDLNDWQVSRGHDSNSVSTASALFIVAEPDGPTLIAGSPAINAGGVTYDVYDTFRSRYNVELELDVLEQPRLVGGVYDVGAYESQ